MAVFVLGLLVFFGIHSVRMLAGPFRERQLAGNERRWKGIYSLLSLLGIVLIVWGWMLYRPEAPQVYDPPEWARHVTLLLVLIAFVLLASANMPAGRIKAAVRHPFLTGIFLWAAAHLLANGDLASLLLFGAFLLYVLINRVAVEARGEPAPAVLRPRSDLMALGAGPAFYLVFIFWLHPLLFGVSPLG